MIGIHRPLLTPLAVVVLAGCADQPEPTPLEPIAAGQVEVAVDNRWDRPLAVDVSTADRVAGILTCRGVRGGADDGAGRRSIWRGRSGLIGDRGGRAMPHVIDSDDLTPVEGGYRVLVRVAQDGSVTADDLVGPSPDRPAGQC